MRENCTYSLSGGRWPARKRATSDPTPAKQPNKGQQLGPAEVAEGRRRAKENADRSDTSRTQGRESVYLGLDRVREAAKQSKEVRFTALLHHVT